MVRQMNLMFRETPSLVNIDVTSFDTSNVTNMAEMFRASGITSLDLSNFKTSNTTNMNLMFTAATALTELNLGENFVFNGNAGLPGIARTSEFTGRWSNGNLKFLSSQLMNNFDPETMAGFWAWETLPQVESPPVELPPVREKEFIELVSFIYTESDATANNHPNASESYFPATGGRKAINATLTAWNLNERVLIGWDGTLRTPIVFNNGSLQQNLGWQSLTSVGVDNASAFEISLSTVGFEEIRFSASQKSTGSGPDAFRLAYRLEGQENFTLIDDSFIQPVRVGNDTFSALQKSFDGFILPETLADQEKIYLRVVFDGLVNARNGNTSINNILIEGIPMNPIIPEIPDEPIKDTYVSIGEFSNSLFIDGSKWRIHENGILFIGSGYINWDSNNSPWANYSGLITRIEITGPITAGTHLRSLFNNLTNVSEIVGLDYFDTTATTDISRMFRGLGVEKLVLSSFDTKNVRYMVDTFRDMNNLVKLDLSSFYIDSTVRMTTMFNSLPELSHLVLGKDFQFTRNPNGAGLQGIPSGWRWVNETYDFTSSQLMDRFVPSTMYGTWIRTNMRP